MNINIILLQENPPIYMARCESLKKVREVFETLSNFTFRTIFQFLINNIVYIIGPMYEKGVVLES